MIWKEWLFCLEIFIMIEWKLFECSVNMLIGYEESWVLGRFNKGILYFNGCNIWDSSMLNKGLNIFNFC